MDFSLFTPSVFFISHLGHSHKGFIKVGRHTFYIVFGSLFLKITDYLLSKKTINKILIAQKFINLIAQKGLLLPHGMVVTHKTAEKILDYTIQTQSPYGSRILVGPCLCEKVLYTNKKPSYRNLVVLHGADIFSHVNLGYKIITVDEAKNLLREFNNNGLVHELYFFNTSGKLNLVLCNCDREICMSTRLHRFLRGNYLIPGPEVMSQRPELCIGVNNCGFCVEKCIFDANVIEDGKIMVDYKYCMGCGQCINTCKGKARELLKRTGAKVHDPIFLRVAKNIGINSHNSL